MNSNDLLKQRMLEALMNQDSSNAKLTTFPGLDSPPIDQAAQFKSLPQDIQNLAIKGGQKAGRFPISQFSGYMQDANQENSDKDEQDYQDQLKRSSDDDKWMKIQNLLKNNSSK